MEVEDEEEEDLDDEEEEDEDLDEEDDEYEEEDEAPRTTTVTNWDWSQVNSESAIWARDASEVEDDEYKSFYKTFSKDTADPTTWIHFKAEGEVEFKSISSCRARCPSTCTTPTTTRTPNSDCTSGRYSLPMNSRIWCRAT